MKKILCAIIFMCFMLAGFSAELTLQWTNSDTADVTGYNLYRSTVHTGPYTKINPALIPFDPSGTGSFVDEDIEFNTRYFWVATAVIPWEDPYLNESGTLESIYSNEATKYFKPQEPNPPTGFIAKIMEVLSQLWHRGNKRIWLN